MSAKTDVTARWYDHLRRDLVLRNKARDMLNSEHSDLGQDVLIVACIALNVRLMQDINYLGGMAAEW